MAIKFPLQNIRRSVTDDWNLIELSQTFTVPSNKIFRLDEVPDNGTIESPPVIEGLSLAITYPPVTNTFYVKYSTGDVIFNDSQVGQTVTITYYGKGSLIKAEDLNFLYNELSSKAPSGAIIFDPGTDDGQMLYWSGLKWIPVDYSALSWNADAEVLNLNCIQFNTNHQMDTLQGMLHWNTEENSLEYGIDGTTVLQIGEEIVARVKNESGDTVTDGMVVRIIGSTGDNPTVTLAQANSYINSRSIYIITQTINNHAIGYATLYGKVRDINTLAWEEGDILYLSPTTAGQMTNTKPSYPNFAVKIGVVIRKHETEGIIHVFPNDETNIHTQGSVLFGNGNGEIGEDNDNFFWDNENNRLGVNTNSPSASFQVIGHSRFGSDTDYSEFEDDGTLSMVGDAKVWDDQQVELGAVGRGASYPIEIPYKGSQLLSFRTGQENQIFFRAQLRHTYALGTDLNFHLHVTLPDNNTGTVIWEMTYSWVTLFSVIPDPTPITKTVTVEANSANKHMMHVISDTIPGAGIDKVSSILLCSLTRKGTTDTYANDVYLMALDFHIEIDSVGSREMIVK